MNTVCMDINERFYWAAGQMTLTPGIRILELGCGAGLFASLLASNPAVASVVGIDRSVAMIRNAVKRNQLFIDQGTVKFIQTEFEMAEFPAKRFDAVCAFNVNAFWKEPEGIFWQIRRWMVPKGTLYIFYQVPGKKEQRLLNQILDQLIHHRFSIDTNYIHKMKPYPCLMVQARPV
jgi:SAM-dependent methyltransferase